MKMKADFLNLIISVLLILLIVPGILPGIASALDGPLGDDGNSTLFSDLRIEGLSNEPRVPEPNSIATVNAIVSNRGNVASDPTFLVYAIDGVESESVENVGSIEPGDEVTIPHSWSTPGKDGTVTVTAYLYGVEGSEKDLPVTVRTEVSLPDLKIESIVPESANPQAGQPLNFNVKVKNQGTATAGDTLATYYINEGSGQNISVPSISAGESTTVSFSLPGDQVTEGQMSVRVIADSKKTVLESNEGNNVGTKTVKVNGLSPDLKVESISLSPETPKIGDAVTFTATIKNIGAGASPASKLKYNVNGTSQTNSGVLSSGTLDIDSIAAGGATPITFIWTPTNEGNIEVTAVVDPDAAIPEGDESNNQNTLTATITKESSSGGGGGGSGGSSSSGKSSSSSGGGIGSSFTKEPAINVAAKELATRNVVSGNHVKFEFLQNVTCIQYIEYDAERTFLRTTTTVEELKNKSAFVPKPPSGRIYKYVNVWVADKIGGLPSSISNGLIGFRIEKSWITNNSINESLVTLQWYNETWETLYTKKIGEDDNYSYFTSTVPGYSFFAITENTGETDKNRAQIGVKLEDTFLGSLGSTGNVALNKSENKSKAAEAKGAAKILMAITLPVFLLFVGYLVVKKKI